jgi:hypothetical protein
MFARRILSLAFAALLVAAPLFAKEPVFPQMPDGFKAGMEVEITPDHLAKIMPFYDFSALQAQRGKSFAAPAGFYDDYLRDNPKALASLPEAVRAKLTKGLQLESLVQKESVKLELPAQKLEVKKPSFQLIQPGAESSRPAGLILPGAKPAEKADNFRASGDGLIKPARMDWETLYERWRALDSNEKAKLVSWELLSPLHKAEIAHELEEMLGAESGPVLKLKKDAPELLKKLYWHQELDAIEFKHATPLGDPQSLYRDIVEFGKLTGVSSKLENAPESRLKGVSLHYHLSVPGRKLEKIAHLLNDLTLLKRVDQGIINDLAGDGLFIYTTDIKTRGLVRLAGPDRIEMRVHPEKLAQELPFLAEILSMPEADAIKRLNGEINALLQKKNVTDLIQKYRPKLFRRWEGMVAKDLLEDAMNPEAAFIRQIGSDDPAVVKAALRNMDPIDLLSPNAQRAAASLLSPRALSTPQGVELGFFLAGRIALGRWPEPVFEQILNLMPKLQEGDRGNLIFNVINREWPPSLEPKLFEYLRQPGISPDVTEVIIKELNEADFAPEFLGRALNADLPAHYRAPVVEKILDSYTTIPWSPAQQETAHLMLRGLPSDRLAEFLPLLREQSGFLPEVLPELAALTKRKDLPASAKAELHAMLKKLSAKSAQAVRMAGVAEEFSGSLKSQSPGIAQTCRAFFARIRR